MTPEDFGIIDYKFRPDGTLDVFQDVRIFKIGLSELPFKFGKIDGNFKCSGNGLESLKGAPEIVNGYFNCRSNYITSLKYAPKIIHGWISYSYNNLTSLNGLNLDGISGKIYLYGNANLSLTEKEQLWVTLNPDRLIMGIL